MTVHAFGNCKLNPANLPAVESGDTIEEWNCCQLTPHTAIFAGKTGLTFCRCNLTNCDPPADSTYKRCLRVYQEFCSNNHPDWIALGLSECAIACKHLTSTDEVLVDGVLIDTIRSYADTWSKA